MYVIPVLSLLCAASLFGAAKTAARDARRIREAQAAAPSATAAEPAT
jgi:hypothetical protein